MSKGTFHYQTSEKVRIEYEIATFPLRCAAFIVDMAIRAAVFILLYFVMIFLVVGSAMMSTVVKGRGGESVSILVSVIIYLIFILALLSYHLIFELAWKGQTPGKRILRLRAVHDNGSYMNFTSVVLRNLFRIVDMLPVGYLLGLIVMLMNEKRKRIGDYVGGTIVIREGEAPLPAIGDGKTLGCFRTLKKPRELFSEGARSLFENYLNVRSRLMPEARTRIEAELTALIELKTGVQKPPDVSREDFIISLYHLLL